MGKNAIPERWEDYSCISEQIPGTRFVAFKVPLKDALIKNLDASVAIFNVNLLIEYCPKLGLVVDLTNTDRYYDSTEIKCRNISFCKLKTLGHVVPANHIYFKFFQTVEDFLSKNKNNGKLIGVHCTHGVNRTGYLIIRYMIQQLKMKPEDAISAFHLARGHAVERENYLRDLKAASWPIPLKFAVKKEEVAIPRNLQRDSRYGEGSRAYYSSRNSSSPYDSYGHTSSRIVNPQYQNYDYNNFRHSRRKPRRKFRYPVPNKLTEASNKRIYDGPMNSYNYTHNNNPSTWSHEAHASQSSSRLANNFSEVNDGNTGTWDRNQRAQSRNSSTSFSKDNSSNHKFSRDDSDMPNHPSRNDMVHFSQRPFHNFNSQTLDQKLEPSWYGKNVYSWKA